MNNEKRPRANLLKSAWASAKDSFKTAIGSRGTDLIVSSTAYHYLKLGEHAYGDYRLRRFAKENYSNEREHSSQETDRRIINPKIVWQIWLQGWDSAPELVKVASELSQRALPDWEFRRLDFDSLRRMNVLQPEILTLIESGHIRPSGIADLARLRLLEEFGGMWLDGTVLLRREFSPDSSFLITGSADPARSDRLANFYALNWMMSFEMGNRFVRESATLLADYWISSGGQRAYFDAFFAMGSVGRSLQNEDFSFVDRLIISNNSSNFMHFSDRKEAEKIGPAFQASEFHKLSWKSPRDTLCTPELISTLWKADQ